MGIEGRTRRNVLKTALAVLANVVTTPAQHAQADYTPKLEKFDGLIAKDSGEKETRELATAVLDRLSKRELPADYRSTNQSDTTVELRVQNADRMHVSEEILVSTGEVRVKNVYVREKDRGLSAEYKSPIVGGKTNATITAELLHGFTAQETPTDHTITTERWIVHFAVDKSGSISQFRINNQYFEEVCDLLNISVDSFRRSEQGSPEFTGTSSPDDKTIRELVNGFLYKFLGLY